MGHVSDNEFRRNIAKYMDEVCRSGTPLVVTRDGAQSVVLLPLEDYESMEETFHLLRSPGNAERLRRSIADAEAGKLAEHDIGE